MFSYYRLVNQNKNLTEEFDKKMKETQDYQKNLEFIIGLKNKNDYFKLPPNINLSNHQNTDITLKNLLTNTTKVFFYVPASLCNVCYDDTFKQLENITSLIPKKDLIILTPYQKYREMRKLVVEKNLPITVYSINNQSLGIELEKQANPFFFASDSTFIGRNVFVPSIGNPNLTSAYLKTMGDRFFKK
jgi:hypothetical protein